MHQSRHLSTKNQTFDICQCFAIWLTRCIRYHIQQLNLPMRLGDNHLAFITACCLSFSLTCYQRLSLICICDYCSSPAVRRRLTATLMQISPSHFCSLKKNHDLIMLLNGIDTRFEHHISSLMLTVLK